MRRRIAALILTMLLVAGGMTAMAERETFIGVDFSKREGVPLLKKFALFNSGIVNLPQYQRDAALFDPIRADSLRIDLFIGDDGKPFAKVVTGTAEDLVYDFDKLDQLVCLLRDHGVRPYWAWCYIPQPLQVDHDWRKGPSSLEAWQEMFRAFAAHYREAGLRIAYNEIYNEPDCGETFFVGSMEDYTQMYIRAARGLKAGDPDSVIGGPSSAFIDVTGARAIEGFLSAVRDAKVPLDFFSYHSYGCTIKQYLMRTGIARKLLSGHPEFDTTELHLNEYNSEIQPFQLNGRAEHSIGAATMLTSFELLLEETDVTLAHWAQFMDTGYEPLGAINPKGRIKAPYWALWMYSQMPEERVSLRCPGKPMEEGMHGLASADENTACILLWNDDGEKNHTTVLALAGLPFEDGTLEIYEMNDGVDPYWNTEGEIAIAPTRVMSMKDVGLEQTIEMAAGGIEFLRFRKAETAEEPVAAPIGRMIRKHYYFPERGKKSYAFFDETDQTSYLGMNGEYSARAIVGTEWDGLPGMLMLRCTHGGRYEEIDLNTSFSVRVDFAVGNRYEKAVTFSFMPINPRRDSTVPWGTGRPPEEIVLAETLLTGKTLLNLRNYAPDGWDGRAIITYDLHSCGPELWVQMTAEGI